MHDVDDDGGGGDGGGGNGGGGQGGGGEGDGRNGRGGDGGGGDGGEEGGRRGDGENSGRAEAWSVALVPPREPLSPSNASGTTRTTISANAPTATRPHHKQ